MYLESSGKCSPAPDSSKSVKVFCVTPPLRNFTENLSMKHALLLLLLAASPLFYAQSGCGDGTLYSWDRQTSGDDRFAEFPKISGKRNGPAIAGGDKQLDKLIKSRLVLTPTAKENTFNLNYYFTVGCNGKVSDVVILGDPIVADWTNIADILTRTTGWKAATVDGKPVDCIYFRTLYIDGKLYPSKKDWK